MFTHLSSKAAIFVAAAWLGTVAVNPAWAQRPHSPPASPGGFGFTNNLGLGFANLPGVPMNRGMSAPVMNGGFRRSNFGFGSFTPFFPVTGFNTPFPFFATPGFFGNYGANVFNPAAFEPLAAYDTGLSGLNGPQPAVPLEPAPADVTVRVPNGAKVWIEGVAMRQQGTERRFVTPELTPGVPYEYEIRASWTENGKPVTETQHVSIHAGAQASISFIPPVAPRPASKGL
jgi:uncharacterized protein (TIGR03000 family)